MNWTINQNWNAEHPNEPAYTFCSLPSFLPKPKLILTFIPIGQFQRILGRSVIGSRSKIHYLATISFFYTDRLWVFTCIVWIRRQPLASFGSDQVEKHDQSCESRVFPIRWSFHGIDFFWPSDRKWEKLHFTFLLSSSRISEEHSVAHCMQASKQNWVHFISVTNLVQKHSVGVFLPACAAQCLTVVSCWLT